MFLARSKLPARALGLICLASVAALATALIAQHGFGIRPCPWCVMQRGVFILIALAAGLGWLFKRERRLRQIFLALVALLSLAGVTAAYYQHEVANKLASCDMTLADRILSALDLETRLPSVFMVTASCSQASAYRFLGLPYELWSGLLFLGFAGLSLLALRKR